MGSAELKSTTIYAAIDPRDSSIRYVGKTTDPIEKRAMHHYSKKGNDRRSSWFQMLRDQGLKAVFVELERIPARGNWSSAEEFWVNYFRFLGADMLNAPIGYALRFKRSSEAKGRPWSEARKSKIRSAMRILSA